MLCEFAWAQGVVVWEGYDGSMRYSLWQCNLNVIDAQLVNVNCMCSYEMKDNQ